MGKRTKLGIVYSYNDKWIGGTYYIMNMIQALKILPDKNQPFIIILSKDIIDYNHIISTGYKYLKYINPYNVKTNRFVNYLGKFIETFNNKNLFHKILLRFKIDVLFPANNEICYSLIKNKIYWIPDFQHIKYPENFTESDLERRKTILKRIASSDSILLLSSKTAKKQFESIVYEKRCNVLVVPFAVTHPDISEIVLDSLFDEFSIKKPYFIISNQFWRHKNHLIVLEAAFLLFNKGYDFELVFTGNYIGEDCEFTFNKFYELCITSSYFSKIKILGLVDRVKQLALMKYSIAVIQPSFFEGWSTVVEDAKCLSKFIILSDIDVHREQISCNALFFDPNNYVDLSECYLKVLNEEISFINNDYSNNIKNYAEKLQNLLN